MTAPSQGAGATGSVVAPSSAAGAHVLIVDDEPLNLRLFQMMLGPEQFHVTVAADGPDALAQIAAHRPDLILLDIMMPGMDGYEVAAIVKADPATAGIPIIMVTALRWQDARARAFNAGADDFLSKPVERGQLCLRVRDLLRMSRGL